MTVPALIATDLDGTLLRSDSTLSDRTRSAMLAVRAQGIRLVAATARPARVIDELFPSDDLIDMAICGNGSVFYDMHDRVVDIRHPLPTPVMEFVMETIVSRIPGAGFANETGHRVLFEPNYLFRPTLDMDRTMVDDRTQLLAEPSVKLMVWLPSEDPAAEWSRLSEALADVVSCTWSSERAPFEIAAPIVSKAAALAEIAARWGIRSAEVMAFGDAPNDLPMLSWAGMSYAVANASPAVLAAAKHRTASNDDDGVARVLEQLVSLTACTHGQP
jgi:Cof subfamily protein (haloacid dehalogenase superfamily)